MNYLARCVFALIMVLVAASPLQDRFVPGTRVASSGAHLWWISKNSHETTTRFELLHHAEVDDERQFQVASTFAENPIGLAADGERVWLVFEALSHKMEVVESHQVQLKGGCHEIFFFYIFHDSKPSGPLINGLIYFRIQI